MRRRNEPVREENKALLEAFLLTHPCVDCGQADLRVLDLDHDVPSDAVMDVAG